MEGRSGKPTFGAVDLGADSGRVFAGTFDGTRVELREVHRFPNHPVWLPDGLHWNLVGLFEQALRGLSLVAEGGPLDGVAVDAWAVDYGLLDRDRRLLGLPYHYRDARSQGMVERAAARVAPGRHHQLTGIQALPINTAFQLLAEAGGEALAIADRLALIPDLLTFWLSGELANERTVASTTALLEAGAAGWSAELIDGLGLPPRIFGPLVEPGTVLGPALSRHGLGSTAVIATASHDTAAAFAAAPAELFSAGAILSSGTWSILGMEVPEPLLDGPARDADLSNEAGVEGTTRLLKNVMGLWLVQECRRGWAKRGEDLSFADLVRLAEAVADEDAPLFDPDHPSLVEPGDMPTRIGALCEAAGSTAPTEPGLLTRSILLSLACKYRLVLEGLESAVGRPAPCVHVVGGGANNALLCDLTAALLDRPVLAGPAEASALGNVLVQAIAVGELGSLADAHEVARASVALRRHEPRGDRDRAAAIYRRFLDLTGLTPPVPIPIERI
ncbi:MAG: rhamnulokinase [Actinobacteria bacterium]|nr:rhamnulokinase [Actinomycetota bacterium]